MQGQAAQTPQASSDKSPGVQHPAAAIAGHVSEQPWWSIVPSAPLAERQRQGFTTLAQKVMRDPWCPGT